MISFVFRVYVFEVWCEQRRLFGNLDIAEAIAGFLHLAFVFDLKYPAVSISGHGIRWESNIILFKGSQTLADILQRQMAKYGDDSGTVFPFIFPQINLKKILSGFRFCIF